MNPPIDPRKTLTHLWQYSGFPEAALAHARLTGHDPVLPSSFAVGTAAQTGVAAAALAACELGHLRGQTRRDLSVDMTHAALECSGWFSLDGRTPAIWTRFLVCMTRKTGGCGCMPILPTIVRGRCACWA